MLETHTSKLQQHFQTAAIHFPHIVSLFMTGITYSLFLCCVRHYIKIQLHVWEFSTKKKTYGLMLPGKDWQTWRWRTCERKDEHYTHVHTKVYLKYKQHSVLIWNSSVKIAGDTKRIVQLNKHIIMNFICYVLLSWLEIRIRVLNKKESRTMDENFKNVTDF